VNAKCVAVAGATGHAGRQIVRALSERGQRVRALVRSPERLGDFRTHCDEVREVQVTDPESLRGALDGVEMVVSALGKTYQKDKTPRRTVDVDANRFLFAEAKRAGVAKIALVSVWGAGLEQPVELLRMKGEAEAALEETAVPWVIVQPSGFFSDMWEVLNMCRGGTFWTFGSGLARFNPIALEDLGDFVASGVLDEAAVNVRRPVGGPDDYNAEALAALCGRVLQRKVRVRRVPMFLRRKQRAGRKARRRGGVAQDGQPPPGGLPAQTCPRGKALDIRCLRCASTYGRYFVRS